MQTTGLTIITVTKDDPNGLARSLASAAAFRRQGAEHIVVDGSADAVLAEKLVNAGDSGVRVISSPPRGIADAFNIGLQNTQGDWVWFLNGGDTIHESADPVWLLEHLRRTKADLVVGAVQFDGETEPRRLPGLRDQWPLIACWLPHQATMVRRELLMAAGGFHNRWRVTMDYDLWLRMIKANTPVDVLSVVLARFATDGISEAPVTSALKWREDAAVVRIHALAMIGYVLRLNLKLCWRLARALVRW